MRDVRRSGRLNDMMSRGEKRASRFKPECWNSAPIFVQGGAVRALLHIILKSINNQSLEFDKFKQNVDLLKFLLFNEQSE